MKNILNSPNKIPSIPKALLLTLSLLCFLFFLFQLWGFYHDDAYIVLRYAKNFLDGKGLVWNIDDKTEGYSCFLWLMLISFIGYCKVDLFFASKILGSFFAILILVFTFLYEKKEFHTCSLLLSTNSCFALWASGGLETIAFCFFVSLGSYAFIKNHHSPKSLFFIGLLFCFGSMTRFEGLLFFSITFLYCFLGNKTTIPSRIWNAFYLLSGFAILYAPYFLWRFWYFGYFFPCTFYVKGDTTNIFKVLFGGRYVFHFFTMYGFPLFILFFLKNIKTFLSMNSYLITLILFYCLYVFIVGGDHMPGFRFFVPLLPVLYLFIAQAMAHVRFQNRTLLFLLIACISILNFYVSFQSIPKTPKDMHEAQSRSYSYKQCYPVPDFAAYVGKSVGLFMQKNWPKDALVAANSAGATPYFSELRFIDMLGLNDYTIAKRHIPYQLDIPLTKLLTSAGRIEIKSRIKEQYLTWQLMPGHGKGDGAYVLSRRPDYIVLGPAEGSTIPWFIGDKEILSSPDFINCYRPRKASISIVDSYNQYFSLTKSGVFIFTYYARIAK